MARTRSSRVPRDSPEHAVEPVPGLDDLAQALLTMRTREEAKRFLRDLCTLPELEALTHRWQIARLVDQGVPYLEIAQRVPTLDRDGDAGRAVGASRVGRLPDRTRAGAGSTGERHGRSRVPARTAGSTLAVPSKGRLGEPALRLCAEAGLSFEVDRAVAARPLRERTGRPAARAAERHPRVRPGRRRRSRHHRRQPRARGGGGGRHDRRPRLRPMHARGGGARGRATGFDRGAAGAARRDRVPRVDPAAAGRARSGGRAGPRLRARSRRPRGSAWPTRSSTSSPPGRRSARTACAASALLLSSQAVLIGGRRRSSAGGSWSSDST